MLKRIALVVALGLLTSGCSLNLLSAPTGHLSLTAHFDDVTDLGPGHTVQVANVVVGSVTRVALDGYRAQVTMSITDGHPIPVGTTATIRRTSLLGEPFVELAFPPGLDAATARQRRSGDQITATSTDPSVEDIAGRTGRLLAAIRPDDLASTVQASAEALGGTGPELHQLIGQLSGIISALDAQHADLAGTIDNLSGLGTKLAPLGPQIGSLIDSTAKTTSTLGADTAKLVTALGTFDHLAATTSSAILLPHADALAALLREASTVIGSLAHNQSVLAHMADSLAQFVPRITRSISKGSLLIFAWVDINATVGGEAVAAVLPPSVAQLVGP